MAASCGLDVTISSIPRSAFASIGAPSPTWKVDRGSGGRVRHCRPSPGLERYTAFVASPPQREWEAALGTRPDLAVRPRRAERLHHSRGNERYLEPFKAAEQGRHRHRGFQTSPAASRRKRRARKGRLLPRLQRSSLAEASNDTCGMTAVQAKKKRIPTPEGGAAIVFTDRGPPRHGLAARQCVGPHGGARNARTSCRAAVRNTRAGPVTGAIRRRTSPAGDLTASVLVTGRSVVLRQRSYRFRDAGGRRTHCSSQKEKTVPHHAREHRAMP